jgi:hypothetical protein
MERPISVPPDPLIDHIRETRANLVRKHGGLRGWVAHLQEEQKKQPEKFRRAPKPPNR